MMTAWATFCVLTAIVTWHTAIGHTNLLVNPSFEDVLGNTWKNNGFDLVRVDDPEYVRHGQYAIKCTGRGKSVKGPFQLLDAKLQKGRHYAFEGYFKLLSETRKPWQTIKANVQMWFPGQAVRQSYNIAFRSFCAMSQGWIRLKGDIEAPQKDIISARFGIKGPDAGVDFVVDNLTLYEVQEDRDWRVKADINIERYRKSNVRLNVNLPSGVNPSEVDVEISLKSHLFAFGAMLRDEYVLQVPVHPVMKLAYYMFNWATIQSYKWKFNKAKGTDQDTNPDFSNAIEATNILNANGIKVRGHSVFWNVLKNVPDWVKKDVSDENLLSRLRTHLTYMINLARGKLAQWDIMNEHIAGHYYEERLNDTYVTKMLHHQARNLNDTAALYMNEFQCVASGAQTEQYHDLAMEYLRENVPVDGLGCQGHTKEYVKPDPTAMWRRISRLAETGLEIMMTEFDIGWPDKLERADWFEDAIRAFFGHPAMRGVILWDFWNETMREPDHELVEGRDLKILESGQRWACLVKKEWTTKVKFNLGTTTSFSLRGFQGDYEVLVKKGGIPVQRETFTLGKADATWALTVTDNTAQINVTPERDYVPQCISHREERTLGTGQTSSRDDALTCTTRASSKSGTGENDAVSVSCEMDEVMTGCSSFHTKKVWNRKGERIEVNDSGRVQCTAYNGRHSTNGVKAYVQCCKVSGLTCDYRTAGPSFPFDGAMAEARCPSGQLALGCSVYQSYPDSDGVKPNDDVTSCLAQSGAPVFSNPAERSGAYVFSACCQAARGLNCVLASGLSQRGRRNRKAANVVCPTGYTMTGCNAFAENGKSAGAKIVVKRTTRKVTCRAFRGESLSSGSKGVIAYAICCQSPR